MAEDDGKTTLLDDEDEPEPNEITLQQYFKIVSNETQQEQNRPLKNVIVKHLLTQNLDKFTGFCG